jgi:5'-nucleotidase
MALMTTGLAACSSSSKRTADIPVNNTVADVTPTAAPTPVTGYQPAAQPVYDSATTMTPTGGAGSLASGSYTVKKGDTLYGIARQRYGDGKQWNKIASANPGLRPETLKVGQTIQLP